jgi:UDP-N-acetylmuramate--alanine ligase
MKNVFFVGINGIGMSGLAKIMNELGYSVAGSDPSVSYLTDEMRKQGITIYSEHKKENLKDADTLVVSTAISKENPEYMEAVKRGIPVLKRGELLAELLNQKTGIAVAGTHGKTTTSSMMATVLMEKDPTIVVGGIVDCIKSNARYGAGEYFVAEADESDNSFLYMRPKYSVITNIEADHLEKHGCLENIKKSFNIFMQQTEREIIVCADNKNIQ